MGWVDWREPLRPATNSVHHRGLLFWGGRGVSTARFDFVAISGVPVSSSPSARRGLGLRDLPGPLQLCVFGREMQSETQQSTNA